MAARVKPSDRATLGLASRWGMLAAATVFFLASYYGAGGVALLAAASLLLAGLGWLSAWLSTWRVVYRRTVATTRAFPGESLAVKVRLTNAKPLPVPWLEVEERLPPDLLGPGVAPSKVLHLPWRSTATWEYQLQCRRRGAYPLGAAELRGGDPYGLATRAITTASAGEILVYPRLLPLPALGLPARAVFGRQRPPRSLFEDPSRMAGLRDYAPGDPFNRIHWKASARQATLQVKVYEPTTTPQALLVLPVEGFADAPTVVGEEAISVVASLAHAGAGLGWAVGAVANGQPTLALEPGAGREQVTLILEGLARLNLQTAVPLAAALAAERPLIPSGSTVVFVCAALADDLLAIAAELGRAGHAVAFVLVGAQAPESGSAFGWPVFGVSGVGGAV